MRKWNVLRYLLALITLSPSYFEKLHFLFPAILFCPRKKACEDMICALVPICDARDCPSACSAAGLKDAWKRDINKSRHSQREAKTRAYFVVPKLPECLSIIRYHDQSPIAGVMFMAGKFILLNDNNQLRSR
jgi:hypothetical protein